MSSVKHIDSVCRYSAIAHLCELTDVIQTPEITLLVRITHKHKVSSEKTCSVSLQVPLSHFVIQYNNIQTF